MKIKINELVSHLPEGDYTGCIVSQSISADDRYLWLKINVEEENVLLNVSLPIMGNVFNNFAKHFADENGEVDTDDFIDSFIEFTLIDREIGGNIYSKIKSIIPVFDDF